VAQKRSVQNLNKSCDNSETVYEIGCQLLLIVNRKLHTGFWLILTSMTLNDLERRNSRLACILRMRKTTKKRECAPQRKCGYAYVGGCCVGSLKNSSFRGEMASVRWYRRPPSQERSAHSGEKSCFQPAYQKVPAIVRSAWWPFWMNVSAILVPSRNVLMVFTCVINLRFWSILCFIFYVFAQPGLLFYFAALQYSLHQQRNLKKSKHVEEIATGY